MPEPSTTSARNTLNLVLPIRTWLRTPTMRKAHVLLFGVLVGFPLFSTWLYHQEFQPYTTAGGGVVPGAFFHDLKWMDWPFVGYFGVAWLIAIWLVVRPRITMRPVAAVALISLVVGGPIAVWLETKLHAQTSNFFSALFAVGGSEELAKTVPVLAAIVLFAKFLPARAHEIVDLQPKAFLYLGAVSGAVFGCAEAVEYIVQSQEVNFVHRDDAFGLTWTLFYRLVTDPINHAMWAGITAFFVGMAVQRARRNNRMTLGGLAEQAWLIGIGLAIAATLHGLHDFANNDLVDVIIDVASVLLMLAYALAGDIVEQAVVAAPGPRWGRRHSGGARAGSGSAGAPRPQFPPMPYPAQPAAGAPVGYPPAPFVPTPPAFPYQQPYPAQPYPGQPYPGQPYGAQPHIAQHPAAHQPAAPSGYDWPTLAPQR
jgi:RsiW-degrading membrane proteinase PrsW (M82 family)